MLSMFEGIETVSICSAKDLKPASKGLPVRAVYAIRNRATGNLYVGSSEHVDRRFRHHVNQLNRGAHHSRWLQHSWNKRGRDQFDFIVLRVFPDGVNIVEQESEFIKTLKPAYNTNLDFAENPMKGRKHKPESIEKMKRSKIGKKFGPRVFSAEHRAALSAAKNGMPSPHQGRTHSADIRAKMSEAAKHRASQPGYVNPRTRSVEFDGVVYTSGKEAAASAGVSHGHLIILIKKNGRGKYLN